MPSQAVGSRLCRYVPLTLLVALLGCAGSYLSPRIHRLSGLAAAYSRIDAASSSAVCVSGTSRLPRADWT